MTTDTRHTCNDGEGPYFGRLTDGCARCDELKDGAKARAWHRTRARQDFSAALRTHDCKRRGCGPVCTFGDW